MRANAQIIEIESSAAFLPKDGPLRRRPRAPRRKRPEAFWAAFEDRALVYDCFHYGEGRILLIGPPPFNLSPLYESAQYVAQPAGTRLTARLYPSRSTMITELSGVPEGTTNLTVAFGGVHLEVPVQPDMSKAFAGRRLLFAINKDNRLEWIESWARWHATMQGTDAIVLFDNGSRTYATSDIEAVLGNIPGVQMAAVIPMPFRFGATDRAVLTYPYWAHFLQISVFGIMLRRFGREAFGLLNCDIDELCDCADGTVYDLARKMPLGLVRMRGRWIEANTVDGRMPRDHLDFDLRRRGLVHRLAAPKWVLDPSRTWVDSLNVQPYWHRIYEAPAGARGFNAHAGFFHFKGITTNWKEQRDRARAANAVLGVVDETWRAAKARYLDLIDAGRRND